MSDDKLSFLSGETPAGPEDTSAPSASAAPAPEPASGGPERDAHGRFAPRASDAPSPSETPPAATPAPPAAAPASPPGSQAEPGHVPISALLDEREKRQAEKARAERYERELAEMRARQAPQAPPAPEEQLQAALYAQNLRTSRRFAERAYSPELVATVHDWAAARCDEDPIFNQQMRASEDPYEAAVQAYRREQLLAAVSPDDLDDYKAWKAAKAAGSLAPAAAPAPSPQAPLPPRSLATASGTGGAGAPHVNAGPGQAFAATLNR